MKPAFFSILPLLTASLLTPAGAAESESPFHLVPAYPHLVFDDNATAAAVVPGAAHRVVVALQRGQVRVLPEDRDSSEAPLFLDLQERMKEETDFEEGLHGLAFHPDFAHTRRVYLCYSQRGPRRTVLSEFIVPEDGPFQADRKTERVLLEFPHPLGNHWGGGIAFGPDGFLYVGIGDGGLRNDPYRLGQNLWTLHGKILRLDVDGRSAGLGYRIPPDNPFASKQEIRGEIWATGLRNPWGMSFDRESGTLWCGDVGQDSWEEVNLIKAGGNYGWSEREGAARFSARTQAQEPEEGGPFIDPVHCYPHTEGISITGGFVYRGRRLPQLEGRYLFGDWGVGKLWDLSWDAASGSAQEVRLLYAKPADHPGFNPTVIAPDADGEPLIFSHHPSMVYTLDEPPVFAHTDSDPPDGPNAPPPIESIEPPGDNPNDSETPASDAGVVTG